MTTPALAAILIALQCPAPPVAPPLETSGDHLVDANGRRVTLNAVSWYGAESPDFVPGGLNLSTPSAIAQLIRQLGFNAVRLPWSNQMFESQPAALQIFDQVVDALAAERLMIILDNHNSNAEWCCGNDGNTLWENAAYPEASWIRDWQNITRRYASQPYVIGADLRNEPRINATWGGDPATDWHAAATRGGNAVLAVNPHLLIFVEGINYATDLSGAAALPVTLNVPNRLVYSAHDYGFDYTGLSTPADWLSHVSPVWGYLITGSNPQPFWLGEFGTCNNSDACVTSVWFNSITAYLTSHQEVNWSYWPLNGTQSSGAGRTPGAPEAYGVLSPDWTGSSLPSLTMALEAIEVHGRSAQPRREGSACPALR